MTGGTNITHMGCFVKIVTVGKSATTNGRANHVAVTTGSMAMGTVIIIPGNLMGRKLVEVTRTT